MRQYLKYMFANCNVYVNTSPIFLRVSNLAYSHLSNKRGVSLIEMTVQIICFFLYFLQETFTPVYYLVLIIVMKMVIPNPTYPAITTPQGSSSVMNFPKLSSNSTQIGIAPNDEKTQTFINETVLKSSILYVSLCILALHKGAFFQFSFRWIYYCHSSKSTGKETGKTHLCEMV